jgi:hypothetical protein
MPAKGFLGEVREAVRHFYAVDMRHEVSDANIRGYLRAASQIEDVWQQVDERIAAALAQGAPPWEAYRRMRYALAFIRATRTHQIFVRELLAADAAFDPATVGYLPPVTYDQCNALCHRIEPDLRHAVAALNDPEFTPDVALPLPLGPRVESEEDCPATHLQGVIAAAREVREWAAGLIAQYGTSVAHAGEPVPAEIAAHVVALNAQLAEADSALRFGVDLAGQASRGEATAELHEQAEDSLWDALETFFLLNQAVAMPELLRPPVEPSSAGAATAKRRGASRRGRSYRDRRIHPGDLWRIASPAARVQLQGTQFGGDEMAEMCEKMGNVLSAGAQQYLDEVETAVKSGDAYMVASMANCPFEPLYRARRQIEIAGATIPAGREFHWNFHRGHIETAPRFGRTQDWQECEE